MSSEHRSNKESKLIAIAGFSVRAAAQCAHRQGFEVVAVDMCGDRDLISHCRLHFRLDDANWPQKLNEQFSGVALLLAGGMENRCEQIDRCHWGAPRPGPKSNQIASMRRLDLWEQWAKACELGWPITIHDSDRANELVQKNGEDEWLLKSMGSAGGSGTIALIDRELALESLSLVGNNTYLQKRIPGENIGVTFLSSEFGTTVVGAAKAWDALDAPHAKKFTYRGSCGPIAVPTHLASKLQQFGQMASSHSQLMGLWQADFIWNDSNLYLLEINPRWSASMDLLDDVYDLALVDMHYASTCLSLTRERFDRFSIGCLNMLTEQPRSMIGKQIIYAEKSLRITESLSDAWWKKRWEKQLRYETSKWPELLEHFFADIPRAGMEIGIGDPILTAMTRGDDYLSIWQALQVAKASVQAQLSIK